MYLHTACINTGPDVYIFVLLFANKVFGKDFVGDVTRSLTSLGPCETVTALYDPRGII
jgi:hypothetical protein